MLWLIIAASIVASIAGVINRRPGWLVAGAALTLPLAWYLAASPAAFFSLLGYALPALHLGAAWAMYRQSALLALFLLSPLFGVAGWFALVVMLQGRG